MTPLVSARGWIAVSLPETTQKEKQIRKGRERDYFDMLYSRGLLVYGD